LALLGQVALDYYPSVHQSEYVHNGVHSNKQLSYYKRQSLAFQNLALLTIRRNSFCPSPFGQRRVRGKCKPRTSFLAQRVRNGSRRLEQFCGPCFKSMSIAREPQEHLPDSRLQYTVLVLPCVASFLRQKLRQRKSLFLARSAQFSRGRPDRRLQTIQKALPHWAIHW
jgi:hypothetical protein